MKHFNQAIVKGVLYEYTKKSAEKGGQKRRFLELVVTCPHPQYGNVRVFGRLWGKKVDDFMKSSKNGDLLKLSGNLAQYKDRKEETKTNFSCFSFEAWKPEEDKHPHKRATFILVGEVISYDDGGTEPYLTLKVKLEGENFLKEETFELSVPGSVCDAFSAPEPGSLVRVKGRIIQDEDDFGDVVVPSRPVIKELEFLNKKGVAGAGNAS